MFIFDGPVESSSYAGTSTSTLYMYIAIAIVDVDVSSIAGNVDDLIKDLMNI
jgi:hypothetical protein